MSKKEVIKKEGVLPPEIDSYITEYLKHKSVKNMADIQEMMRNMFGPAMQRILNAEMEAKIGYGKNERSDIENYRNGYYPERIVNTAYGEMPVKIPRDRMGEIESDLIPKYSRNINGFEEKVIAMYALGMTESEISGQIYDLFGCKLTDDMISDITDKILPDIQDWQKRKLDKIYPIIFIDATHFNVRDNGTVVKKAAYIVLGINSEGMKDVLSITVGENESAKIWMNILTDLKNRGLQDILIICADGLSGIKEAISAVYPKTEYQRCIVHQIRNSLKFVSYKEKKEMVEDMKLIYTASSEENGYKALLEFEEKWIKKYPSAVNSWINNWDVLSTFFKFSPELRKIMYTTNAIESLNNRYKSANKKRPVFPTNTSLLKVLYLNTKNIVKKWIGRIKDWDMILNQLKIMYDNRI